jgi:hypothetical protein
MPRRPAQITQVDVARIIRAAKQAGASEVVVKIGNEASVRIPLAPEKCSKSSEHGVELTELDAWRAKRARQTQGT